MVHKYRMADNGGRFVGIQPVIFARCQVVARFNPGALALHKGCRYGQVTVLGHFKGIPFAPPAFIFIAEIIFRVRSAEIVNIYFINAVFFSPSS